MEHDARGIAAGHNQIRAEIVTTYEQLLHAYAVRSICFIEENGMKAQQMFDGNDYQATHVILYSGDEPIGALRIRWFKGFAKFERFALRKAYRDNRDLKSTSQDSRSITSPAKDTTRSSLTPCRCMRGCGRYFWVQERRRQEAGLFRRASTSHVKELVKEITPPLNAISEHTDVAVLFRTEGFWDAPSEFETATAARN